MSTIKTPHIDKELKLIGDDLYKALVQQLGTEGLSGSDLAKNITYDVIKSDLKINIPGYGTFVDSGTKPHTVPISELKAWAEPKGLNPWAVQKSIAKWGTKAQPFLFKITDMYDEIGNRIADAGVEDITVPIDAKFKETGATVK